MQVVNIPAHPFYRPYTFPSPYFYYYVIFVFKSETCVSGLVEQNILLFIMRHPQNPLSLNTTSNVPGKRPVRHCTSLRMGNPRRGLSRIAFFFTLTRSITCHQIATTMKIASLMSTASPRHMVSLCFIWFFRALDIPSNDLDFHVFSDVITVALTALFLGVATNVFLR